MWANFLAFPLIEEWRNHILIGSNSQENPVELTCPFHTGCLNYLPAIKSSTSFCTFAKRPALWDLQSKLKGQTEVHERNRYGVKNAIIKSQEVQQNGFSSCRQREEWDLKLNSQNSLGFDGILGSLYLNCTKIEVKGFIHSTAGYWRGSEIVSGAQ